jgi:hypothetical protein
VGLGEGVGVAEGVGVGEGVAVGVGVGVADGVAVGVGEGVAVSVGSTEVVGVLCATDASSTSTDGGRSRPPMIIKAKPAPAAAPPHFLPGNRSHDGRPKMSVYRPVKNRNSASITSSPPKPLLTAPRIRNSRRIAPTIQVEIPAFARKRGGGA